MVSQMELDSAADCRSRHHEEEEKQQQQQLQHFHVLAVDDSQIDRKLLEKLLRVSSYQVTCVDSGDKALEYLGLLHIEENNECEGAAPPLSKPSQQEVSKINLIMTDYSMPGITGYDLLKRIKDSSWKDIPVVVMSSENVPARINMCLEGGAEEFLLKPVKQSDLRKLHSNLLNSTSQLGEDHPCHQNAAAATTAAANLLCATDEKTCIDNSNNREDEGEIDTNCSSNSCNRRKATLTTLSSSSSDLSSDRRPRVQELPVS